MYYVGHERWASLLVSFPLWFLHMTSISHLDPWLLPLKSAIPRPWWHKWTLQFTWGSNDCKLLASKQNFLFFPVHAKNHLGMRLPHSQAIPALPSSLASSLPSQLPPSLPSSLSPFLSFFSPLVGNELGYILQWNTMFVWSIAPILSVSPPLRTVWS